MKQLVTIAHNRLKIETETNAFVDVVEVVLVVQDSVYKVINRDVVKVPKVETVRFCLTEGGLQDLIKSLCNVVSEIENSKNETPC